MNSSQLDVINRIAHLARVSRGRQGAIERELLSHLEEQTRDLILAGWARPEAEREAAARLGDPEEIGQAFASVYRRPRRSQVGAALALATGMILGVYGVGGSFASATAVHHHTPTVQHVTGTHHRPAAQ